MYSIKQIHGANVVTDKHLIKDTECLSGRPIRVFGKSGSAGENIRYHYRKHPIFGTFRRLEKWNPLMLMILGLRTMEKRFFLCFKSASRPLEDLRLQVFSKGDIWRKGSDLGDVDVALDGAVMLFHDSSELRCHHQVLE